MMKGHKGMKEGWLERGQVETEVATTSDTLIIEKNPAAAEPDGVAVQTVLHSKDITTLESEAKKIKDENMILKAEVQTMRDEVEQLTLNEIFSGMMIKRYCTILD